MLKETFDKKNVRVEFIDGDKVREFFEHDLGYSRNERIMNIKRIVFAAKLLAENGTNAIVANIAPYYEVRDFIRKHISNYIQIYLRASLACVTARDVKGHYEKHKNGMIKNVIGVDDGYDIPRNPNLVIDTDSENVEISFKKISDYIKKRGL
jgi:adenylylsulfate kinase